MRASHKLIRKVPGRTTKCRFMPSILMSEHEVRDEQSRQSTRRRQAQDRGRLELDRKDRAHGGGSPTNLHSGRASARCHDRSTGPRKRLARPHRERPRGRLHRRQQGPVQSPRTIEQRESRLRRHIRPVLGDLSVANRRVAHSRKVIEDAQRRGVKSVGRLADIRQDLAAMHVDAMATAADHLTIHGSEEIRRRPLLGTQIRMAGYGSGRRCRNAM